MTGYYISIGYLSGYSGISIEEEAWKILKEVAIRLLRESKNNVDYNKYEYLNSAMKFREKDIDNERPFIALTASSFGGDRTKKEKYAREFCREVISIMHDKGIEVNLEVF